jgi:hypothetical protein
MRAQNLSLHCHYRKKSENPAGRREQEGKRKQVAHNTIAGNSTDPNKVILWL